MEDKENEEILTDLVESVLSKLETESEIKISSDCHRFVERALRAKDYSVDKAAQFLTCFWESIKVCQQLYEKWEPKRCANLFCKDEKGNEEVMTVLKSRDDQDHQVLLFKFGKWDPEQFSFDDLITGKMLFFCWVVGQSWITQRKGVVLVFDLTNFGMKQLHGIKISTLTCLIKLTQDSAPGRIKGIHLIFHPRVFGILFQIVKPLLKDKLKRRIHFHGDDPQSLHRHVKPEVLPESLGGNLGEQQALDLNLIQEFIQDESYCTEILAFGIPRQ